MNSSIREATLRVQEAKKRDSGRNIARVDQEVMEGLDIKTGDVIALVGKKESAGIAWPSYPQDGGLGIIRIDARLKKNTGSKLDDTIKIRKANVQTARKIALAPVSVKLKSNPRFETFVKRKLRNYPVTLNDYVNIPIGISRDIMFKIINMKPVGVCQIKKETVLNISEHTTKDEEIKANYVTYEDVGGLGEAILEIKEIIEFHFKIPSLSKKFGISPPQGILIYGPSGCGKSLLVKAISNESDIFFISLKGTEIWGKFYGESEKKLRDIFTNAEDNRPSIIVFENVEIIAPKINKETRDPERRVIAEFKNLIDEIHVTGNVIVIGITNKIDLLEPTLIGTGRFDRIIEIKLPEEKSREEIFRIHTRKLPLEKSVSLIDLAKRSQKFSGADISAVCKEALIFAMRRSLPQDKLDSELINPKLLKHIEITPNDFELGLEKISKNVKLRLKLQENNKTKENNN